MKDYFRFKDLRTHYDNGTNIKAFMPIEAFLDPRMTLHKLRALGAIVSYANKETMSCSETIDDLCHRSYLDKSEFSKATRKLVADGWLIKEGKGGLSKPCKYTVTPPSIASMFGEDGPDDAETLSENTNVQTLSESTNVYDQTLSENTNGRLSQNTNRGLSENTNRIKEDRGINRGKNREVAESSKPTDRDIDLDSNGMPAHLPHEWTATALSVGNLVAKDSEGELTISQVDLDSAFTMFKDLVIEKGWKGRGVAAWRNFIASERHLPRKIRKRRNFSSETDSNPPKRQPIDVRSCVDYAKAKGFSESLAFAAFFIFRKANNPTSDLDSFKTWIDGKPTINADDPDANVKAEEWFKIRKYRPPLDPQEHLFIENYKGQLLSIAEWDQAFRDYLEIAA